MLTVAPEDCVIYQIVDGELVDVTASFTALQNDDGDYVFQTKTRELGCYIIAEAEAAAFLVLLKGQATLHACPFFWLLQ